jgi:hypothetical protein
VTRGDAPVHYATEEKVIRHIERPLLEALEQLEWRPARRGKRAK